MRKTVFGTILVLLFVAIALIPWKDDRALVVLGLLLVGIFFLLPGSVLIYLGWSEHRPGVGHQKLRRKLTVLCVAIPVSPLVALLVGSFFLNVYEGFRDGLQFRRIVAPLREGRMSAQEVGPQLLEYVKKDERKTRQKQVIEELVGYSIPGSESLIINVLDRYGDKNTAEMLLNCGNPQLETAAQDWARRNGYQIQRNSGSASVRWQKNKR